MKSGAARLICFGVLRLRRASAFYGFGGGALATTFRRRRAFHVFKVRRAIIHKSEIAR